jgi:hypothetical protein
VSAKLAHHPLHRNGAGGRRQPNVAGNRRRLAAGLRCDEVLRVSDFAAQVAGDNRVRAGRATRGNLGILGMPLPASSPPDGCR